MKVSLAAVLLILCGGAALAAPLTAPLADESVLPGGEPSAAVVPPANPSAVLTALPQDWETEQPFLRDIGRQLEGSATDELSKLDAVVLVLGVLMVIAGSWALAVDWVDWSFLGMPGRARERRLFHEEIGY